MNIVFWFLVACSAIVLWVILCDVFTWVGRKLSRLCRYINKIITKDFSEEIKEEMEEN